MLKVILVVTVSFVLALFGMLIYANLQASSFVRVSDSSVSQWSHLINSHLGNNASAHILASQRVFDSKNPKMRELGFRQLKKEYENGSMYSAGKLGWAYQRGLGVDKDLAKAIELYEEAASHGMTYWQYLLAHAYREGYLGFEKNDEKYRYWLNYRPKVHVDTYECWVASYYRDGIFPENPSKESDYKRRCLQSHE